MVKIGCYIMESFLNRLSWFIMLFFEIYVWMGVSIVVKENFCLFCFCLKFYYYVYKENIYFFFLILYKFCKLRDGCYVRELIIYVYCVF